MVRIRPSRLAAAVVASLLTAPLTAQDAPPAATPAPQGAGRIAWLNFQQVVANMPGYAAAESLLTSELASAREEVQRLQVRLDSMVSAYEQQQIALSPSVRQQRQQDIRDAQLRFQQRAQELEESYATKEREAIGPLEQRARAVVEGLRAERNLAIVFDISTPGSNIITADRALDITALAIQRLNAPQQ